MKPDTSMWSAQSDGLGTKAGDQQYVYGILSVSATKGASVIGKGCKSKDFRKPLITSASLPVLVDYDQMGFSTCPCHVKA